MKKIILLLLLFAICLTGCTTIHRKNKQKEEIESLELTGLSDPNLSAYVEDALYDELVEEFNSTEYFIENIQVTHVSNEYLEELHYNTQSNIYFGYSLEQIDEAFGDQKYIFDIDENGNTIVKEVTVIDDHFDDIIKNVSSGLGVILICVTVSVLASPIAPAVSVIFAASAKTATSFALSSAALDGVITAAVTGYQTGKLDETLNSGMLAASEGFKWGAIFGASTAVSLKGASRNGLTMNQVALIQKESKYPLDVLKQFSSMEQYEICKKSGLTPQMINGKTALTRKIDLGLKDEFGRTNLERMQQGSAALDSNGISYELHHIGQKIDSTLAILTKSEHVQNGNYNIWHDLGLISEVHTEINNWDTQRIKFWESIAKSLE